MNRSSKLLNRLYKTSWPAWLAGFCLLPLLLGACLPIAQPTSFPTHTPTPLAATLTPTATIVWFPPTATYTPFPTRVVIPTPDMLTGLGDVILTDTFKTASAWTLSSSTNGGVALSKNELTIAISDEKAYIYSVRQQPILANFYAEITASPSLCQGQDEFGLLIRFNSSANTYRFSATCDGQVRMDRLAGGDASSPQPWMVSGAYPPGAPNIIRLGVWAVGDEMRYFVNNLYQFTVHDPVHTSGSLGIFARSTGGHALTVNFSDLVVREVK